MHHNKYSYVKKVVESGMPVLLSGPAGSGKSTMAMQIAEDIGIEFSSVSCTKQMSVNALLGFISINGVYIPTQFRDAFENGKVFLLDEVDAADPNVLLCLNTIENGFISFPDGIVKKHPNFRLIATANPADAHSTYTGRSKLDFSTIDRYFHITLDRDPELELSLTSSSIVEHANLARDILNAHGVTSTVTMRDAIRMHKLSQLDISDCIYHDVVFHKHPDLYNEFTTDVSILAAVTKKKTMTQSEATSVDELWEIVQREAQQATTTSDSSEDRKVLARELVQKFISTDGISPLPADWAIERKIASSSDNPYDTYKVKYLPNNTTYTFDESEFIPF
jgi:DNA polymerase III delta prime subunit